jgi:hypothetical protein
LKALGFHSEAVAAERALNKTDALNYLIAKGVTPTANDVYYGVNRIPNDIESIRWLLQEHNPGGIGSIVAYDHYANSYTMDDGSGGTVDTEWYDYERNVCPGSECEHFVIFMRGKGATPSPVSRIDFTFKAMSTISSIIPYTDSSNKFHMYIETPVPNELSRFDTMMKFSAIVPIKENNKFFDDAVTTKFNDRKTLSNTKYDEMVNKAKDILTDHGYTAGSEEHDRFINQFPVFTLEPGAEIDTKFIDNVYDINTYAFDWNTHTVISEDVDKPTRDDMITYYKNIIIPSYKNDYRDIDIQYQKNKNRKKDLAYKKMLRSLNLDVNNIFESFGNTSAGNVKDAYIMTALNLYSDRKPIDRMLYDIFDGIQVDNPYPPESTNPLADKCTGDSDPIIIVAGNGLQIKIYTYVDVVIHNNAKLNLSKKFEYNYGLADTTDYVTIDGVEDVAEAYDKALCKIFGMGYVFNKDKDKHDHPECFDDNWTYTDFLRRDIRFVDPSADILNPPPNQKTAIGSVVKYINDRYITCPDPGTGLGDTYASRITFWKQVDAFTVKEIKLTNLSIVYEFKNGSTISTSIVDRDVDKMYIPAPLNAINKLKYKIFEEVYESCFIMMAYSTQKIKIRWYQTGWFSAIMKIVMIVLVVLSIVFTEGTTTEAIINGFTAFVVAYAVGKIGEQFGGVVGAIVSVAAAIVIAYYTGTFDFTSSDANWTVTAVDTIKILNQGVSTYFSIEMKDLVEKSQDFMMMDKTRREELAEEFEKLTDGVLKYTFDDIMDHFDRTSPFNMDEATTPWEQQFLTGSEWVERQINIEYSIYPGDHMFETMEHVDRKTDVGRYFDS